MATQQEDQKNFYDYAQGQLRQRLGSQDWLNIPNVIDPLQQSARGAYGGSLPPGARQGQLSVPYGTSPTPADVNTFIMQNGGYPALGAQTPNWAGGQDGTWRTQGPMQQPYNQQTFGQPFGATMAPANQYANPAIPRPANVPVNQFQGPPQASPMQQLVDSFKQQMLNANNMNNYRYQQGLELYGGLHDRNQYNDRNWGFYQSQINEERAKEALGNESASLAARGLGNSTILPAFQQRNARDLALTQQALSEQRDQRLSADDTRDTGNLAQFIERRNDIGPNINQLQGLAQLYGSSGASQQQGQFGSPQQPQGPQAPTFTPAQGNQQGGQQGGQRFYPSPIGGRGIGGSAPLFLNSADIYGNAYGFMGPTTAQIAAAHAQRAAQQTQQQAQPAVDPYVMQYMDPSNWQGQPDNTAGEGRVASEKVQRILDAKKRREAGYWPGDATAAVQRQMLQERARRQPPQLGIPATGNAAQFMQGYAAPSVFDDPTLAAHRVNFSEWPQEGPSGFYRPQPQFIIDQ